MNNYKEVIRREDVITLNGEAIASVTRMEDPTYHRATVDDPPTPYIRRVFFINTFWKSAITGIFDEMNGPVDVADDFFDTIVAALSPDGTVNSLHAWGNFECYTREVRYMERF